MIKLQTCFWEGCNVGKSCGLNLARSTMLTIGGSDALFAFLISNNNFKVLWYFSSGDSSGATFIPYESMLHVALSFFLIFIFLAFTGSTFAPIVIS